MAAKVQLFDPPSSASSGRLVKTFHQDILNQIIWLSMRFTEWYSNIFLAMKAMYVSTTENLSLPMTCAKMLITTGIPTLEHPHHNLQDPHQLVRIYLNTFEHFSFFVLFVNYFYFLRLLFLPKCNVVIHRLELQIYMNA